MTNLYAFEVPIHATAYIKAADEVEARAALATMLSNAIDVTAPGIIDGRPFDEMADAPQITFSPAMTIASETDDTGDLVYEAPS